MELQVAATSLSWSQPSGPHSPCSSSSSSKTLASASYTPSSRRRSFSQGDRALLCRCGETSSLLNGGFKLSKLRRSLSYNREKSRVPSIRRTVSASLDRFSDEEFEKRVDEFARMFDNDAVSLSSEAKSRDHLKPFDILETPEFLERHEIFPVNIEGKASYADSPFHVGIVRRGKLWEEGLMQAGETAYCSVKKAFSSMVFIIRELHSFTLHMRGIHLYEDLQGILKNVQKEIHASFVWLFQKVFSHTPTLMVSVMILLANYSVYSMSTTAAIAAMPQVRQYTVTSEEVFAMEDHNMKPDLDSLIVRKFTLSSSDGKTTSLGGNWGSGGGKFGAFSSSNDGDDRFDKSSYHQTITPDEESLLGNNPSRTTTGEESASSMEEENLWISIVDEASKKQVESSDEHIDQDSMQQFVSPIDAKIKSDEYPEYFRTELQYQMSLAEDPYNPLLLANYAQFLYLVAQDFDRAEDYFKRAAKIEPKDADALNKYAKFLWLVRNDTCASEETFLESIAAENENSYYAADYAHFLWSTGGEDTCFPLNSPDAEL